MDEDKEGTTSDGANSNQTNDSVLDPCPELQLTGELSPVLDGDTKEDVMQDGESKSEEDDENDSDYNNSDGDSEEEEDEGDEDDEDDEETEPPKLKYTRFSTLPHSFYNKDAISSSLFHSSVIVFATHTGFVHLMRPDLTPIRTIRAHRASVLSIHTDGEYVATGSMDGTVAIGSINNPNDIFAVDLKRPIHAVVLDGQYSVSKSFISGGTSGKVILSTKNWLGQRVDTVLHESSGIILELDILGDLVTWMDDSGISFYQLSSRTKLYEIKLPEGFPRPDLYWPKIEVTDDSLLVAWANNIWLVKLIGTSFSTNHDTVSMLSSKSYSSEKRIHIEKHIQLKDTLIAGISSFNNDFLVLNYTGNSQPPELKIISGITLEDLSVDEVEMRNFPSLGLNDYQLWKYNGNRWFLIGANDVIIVDVFDDNDRLSWFMNREDYIAAWKISIGLLPDTERYLRIGSKQLEEYAKQDQWDAAGQFLVQALEGVDDHSILKREWEFWIKAFQNSSKYDEIVDRFPSAIQLDSEIYHQFIEHYLSTKTGKFMELIRSWDHKNFDVAKVNTEVGEIINNYDQGDKDGLTASFITELRDLHIDLCVELHDYSHAARHLFKAKNSDVLKFLSDNHLLRELFESIPEALSMGISKDELKYLPIRELRNKLRNRIEILIDNREEISPNEVTAIMNNEFEVINYLYFQQLFNTAGFIPTNFEDDMVKLCAKFEPEQLLTFLQKYKSYNIELAIDICRENNLTKELVFLYSRIGQNKRALDLIINELDDPQYAIEFTLSLKDSELFEHLVEYSADKPSFIKALIIEAGNNQTDPKKIISRVPSAVEIENLQKTLVNILNNNKSELLIHTKVLKIIHDETMTWIYSLRDAKLRGDAFDPAERKEFFGADETLIKFDADENIYRESEVVGAAKIWNHVVRDLSDKIKHFIYIKNQSKKI